MMAIPDEGMQPTSRKAFLQAQHDVNEQTVLHVIRGFGEHGCISDDVQEALGINNSVVPYSSVTGPYVILERKFYIERRGDERLGHRFQRMQLVMRALSEDERQRRLALAAEQAKAELTEKAFEAIRAWYGVHELLIEVQAAETALKQQVVDLLFPNAPLGKSEFTFPDGNRLALMKKRASVQLLPLKKKRIRK